MKTILSNHNPKFDYIKDIEKEYFATFYKNPKLFEQYYVKKSIFVDETIADMMKILEDLYNDNKSTTAANIFVETQKQGIGITLPALTMMLQKTKTIDINTIPNTIKDIKGNKARMQLFEIASKALNQSSDVKLNIPDLISEVSRDIELLQEDVSLEGDDFDDIMAQIINDTKSIFSGKKTIVYKTGVKEIDKKIPFVENNITLIGGPAKAGKSRFLLWLMKILMDNNPDVFAVNWYSFEEDSKELARKFIANDTLLRDSVITGKERELTDNDLDKIIESSKKFKNHIIKIEPNPRNINQIKSEFQIFSKKHSNKVPILIIDNLLLLTDEDGSKRDDHIMNTINHIKQRTKAMIYIVHHFNDAQQDKEREKIAFRPLIKHLKGQESYRRVPKVILLVNYPYKYKELMNKFKNERDILRHMFIVDVAAVRDMPEIEMEDKSSDEPNLIHMYAELDFNIFCPLSQLY